MITSAENKQLKHVVQLNTKTKARKKAGLFVVEGIKMFLEAPMNLIEKVYVSESFFTSDEGKEVLNEKDPDRFGKEGEGLEVVTDRLFLQMSDTLTPQGVLTLVRKIEWNFEDLFPKDGRKPLILVLDGLQDPGNLGTIIRTGEGAGVTGVVMSQDTVDITNPKTIRATMGSIYRIPQIISDDLLRDIDRLKERGIRSFAAHLKGERNFFCEDYQQGVAFLIGNEGNGLRDEVADKADCYVRIPMDGEVESLNAAIAASVMMYECKRQRMVNKD